MNRVPSTSERNGRRYEMLKVAYWSREGGQVRQLKYFVDGLMDESVTPFRAVACSAGGPDQRLRDYTDSSWPSPLIRTAFIQPSLDITVPDD